MNIQKAMKQYYEIWLKTNKIYEQWSKKYDLTANMYFTLYTIHSTQNCTQKMICEALHLPKQTVNSILKNFTAAGYIAMQEGKEDKRSKYITFTDKGRLYAGKLVRELKEAETQAFSSVQREVIKEALHNSDIITQALEKFLR